MSLSSHFGSLGPYANFIVACYALVTAVVLILIVWITLDYRRQKALLHDLDKAGIARRSGRPASDIR